MRPGTLLFIFIVVEYFTFEIFVVSRVAYRMEPLYIFERFVAVDRAMNCCSETESDMQVRFTRNWASVQRRAERELAK